jgi:hypothetical protein
MSFLGEKVRYRYIQVEAAKLEGVQVPDLEEIRPGTLQHFIDGNWAEVEKRGIGINNFAALVKHLQTEHSKLKEKET